MSTTTGKDPVMGGGRVRDDMYLGSPGQDYLLQVDARTVDAKTIEATRAAVHVSLGVLAAMPDLARAEHVTRAREILVQLGLLETLQPTATLARAA